MCFGCVLFRLGIGFLTFICSWLVYFSCCGYRVGGRGDILGRYFYLGLSFFFFIKSGFGVDFLGFS